MHHLLRSIPSWVHTSFNAHFQITERKQQTTNKKLGILKDLHEIIHFPFYLILGVSQLHMEHGTNLLLQGTNNAVQKEQFRVSTRRKVTLYD